MRELVNCFLVFHILTTPMLPASDPLAWSHSNAKSYTRILRIRVTLFQKDVKGCQ